MQTCCSTIPQYLLCLHKSFAYNMTTPLHAGNHTTHLLAACLSRNDFSPHLSPHPSGEHVQVLCLAECFWDDRPIGAQPSDWPHVPKSVELFEFYFQRFWPAGGQCHYFWPLLDEGHWLWNAPAMPCFLWSHRSLHTSLGSSFSGTPPCGFVKSFTPVYSPLLHEALKSITSDVWGQTIV